MSADPTRPSIASAASAEPRWGFLIGWWLGSERSGNNVFLGPNPSRFHPPSLRPEAPIGQAPPVFPFSLALLCQRVLTRCGRAVLATHARAARLSLRAARSATRHPLTVPHR